MTSVSGSNPRIFGRFAPSMPAEGKIGELENRRIEAHRLGEQDDPAVVGRAIIGADKLPAVIIGIMRHQKNRLLALHDFARDKRCTIWRLIKGPRVSDHNI